MNIQIFGTKKSFDTKKAQRYFKERRIKFQFIDLKEKEMSKGELMSVMQAAGGIDALIDPKAKDQDTVALITYLAESQKFDKLLENQQVLREPIVRNGKLRIYRDDVMIVEGAVRQLKRFKDDVKEVSGGFECGVSIDGFDGIKVGDVIECYITEEIPA